MAVYELRTFEPGDVLRLSLRPFDRALIQSISLEVWARAHAEHPSVSLWRSEQLLGCFGLVMPWKGFGTAWALLDRRAADFPVAVARYFLALLAEAFVDYELRRVEMLVQAEDKLACRLASWRPLKFCEQRLKPHYGPNGETFIEYVRYG